MSMPAAISEDIPFAEADFSAIAELLHSETGIFLGDNKKSLVYARLNTKVRALGFSQFSAYIRHIRAVENAAERQDMISTLTTNVTSFYREPHHFEDLSTRVLPPLLQLAKQGGRVRIWSAACSSGEEPYTIAFEVLRLAPEAAGYDLKILATDIDPAIVRIGQEGRYSKEIASAIPARLRPQFLTSVPSGFEVSNTAKSLISFRRLNLLDPLPFSGDFDVIFCRNVTIYFDPDTRDKTWQQVVSVLKPSGQLYAGHSERVSGPAAKLLKINGLTGYECLK